MKAVILAGGKGTRLWPLSRENYPKQFVEFKDGHSLFQFTIKRLLALTSAKDIFTISSEQYKFALINQIELIQGLKASEKNQLKQNIIFEPAAKNTLPAIALAVKYLEEKRKLKADDVVGVFPSDHAIEPQASFVRLMKKGEKLALRNRIVVFGVPPSSPNDGYGYILAKGQLHEGHQIDKFVEKPTVAKAKQLLKKKAFWNAGIYCFTKQSFLEDLQQFQPNLNKIYSTTFDNFVNYFDGVKADSIDYGIMQKTDKGAMISFDLKWSDLGSWDNYIDFHQKNGENQSIGNSEFVSSKNCFGYSKDRLLSFIGLDDVIAIDSADSLLLIKKGESGKVKDLVAQFEKKKMAQSKDSNTVHRPWGYYTILHEEKNYKVKEIGVYPNKSLSLQKHKHRSEHWNVVEGKVKVLANGKTLEAKKNESIYIPKNTKHRIYNQTNKIAKIIETQIGDYLGEDDIIRYTSY